MKVCKFCHAEHSPWEPHPESALTKRLNELHRPPSVIETTGKVVRNGIRTNLPTAEQQKAKAKRYRKATEIPAKVKAEVRARSGGRCEIAGPNCLGRATQYSHEVHKQMGGRKGEAKARIDSAVNILHACGVCHGEEKHNLVIKVAQ
jgi:hypothetical protein